MLAAFAATSYYQRINWFKIKITKKWCHSDNIALGFFMCNIDWSLLNNIGQGFYLHNVVPRVLRQHWRRFFLYNVAWSLLDNMAQDYFSYFAQCCRKKIKTTLKKIFLVPCCLQPQGRYIGFFLWNIFPRALRQHSTRFFIVQCYWQPLGQHCTRLLPVQCCPKSITTTLNWIFPMQYCLDNTAQGFYLSNVVFLFFFNWDSLRARLNSHYKAWSYKKKEHKKIKAYRKSI